MAERFSEMENSSVSSKATLEERLKEYPKLKAKIETMLGIIENACAKDKSAWRKEKQDIESAHRYVFQKRLKLSGAWWKTENLKKVIALRVLRANRGSEDYWNNLHQEAA